MKRVKHISVKDYFADVDITVRVSNTAGLSKDEVDGIVSNLADSAMRAINETRYLKVPLSKIKVS